MMFEWYDMRDDDYGDNEETHKTHSARNKMCHWWW